MGGEKKKKAAKTAVVGICLTFFFLVGGKVYVCMTGLNKAEEKEKKKKAFILFSEFTIV